MLSWQTKTFFFAQSIAKNQSSCPSKTATQIQLQLRVYCLSLSDYIHITMPWSCIHMSEARTEEISLHAPCFPQLPALQPHIHPVSCAASIKSIITRLKACGWCRPRHPSLQRPSRTQSASNGGPRRPPLPQSPSRTPPLPPMPPQHPQRHPPHPPRAPAPSPPPKHRALTQPTASTPPGASAEPMDPHPDWKCQPID